VCVVGVCRGGKFELSDIESINTMRDEMEEERHAVGFCVGVGVVVVADAVISVVLVVVVMVSG
jgi:hypothetical protein